MSGSFNEIDVPPTLVSFAVDVAKEGDIITPEFKKAGNPVYLFTMEKDAYDLPVYAQVMKLYDTVHTLIQSGAVAAAYALDGKGIALAVKQDGIRKQAWRSGRCKCSDKRRTVCAWIWKSCA